MEKVLVYVSFFILVCTCHDTKLSDILLIKLSMIPIEQLLNQHLTKRLKHSFLLSFVVTIIFHIFSCFIHQTLTLFSTTELRYIVYRIQLNYENPFLQQMINYLAALHTHQSLKLPTLTIYRYSFCTTDQQSTKRSETYATFIKVPKDKIILPQGDHPRELR
ncbi:uncharacterized protein RHIMIDRAFT_86082 [Rhizopus microsporus ATCC 52813]|uniref:Uncharacterized protein n=1 Tax=Rhizopus microsporus ATCC 52813 TaxID=1340429 RepID=A0A2G4T2I5_RHIZD|nr:uncharacterized protein RHIMIDRAFT_86082 [Rhizopus microsporus ATCC 52813]PHZ15225.1 hypothetical protein RHIMIDRAFT_86082 [Rhizopus microsporus ATCC 52813]